MFKSAATKIAHNSTIPSLGGNKDLRPLQDLITAEKAVLISLHKLSVDFAKAAEALRTWGTGEGDDLGDTLGASTTLLTHFASALSQYAAHGHPMRDHLKAIRTREENLDDLKRRRKNVVSKAESAERKLSKMSPEHKNLPTQTDTLNVLRAEIRSLDSEIMSEEASLGDFKRSTTRAWMGLKFGGLLECSEKGTITGEFGKLIISEIPEETTQPGMPRSLYYGHPKTESLLSEAYRCINEVTLSLVPSSRPRVDDYPQNKYVPQPLYQDNGSYRIDSSGPSDAQRQSGDVAPPGTAPPNYPPPQDFDGLGHLRDQHGSPSASAPTSPIQQQGPPQQFMTQYPSNPADTMAPRRSFDDFTVNQTLSHPTEQPGEGPSAGRFATFPVKTRTPGTGVGYSLRDDPPSLHANYEADDSFSSSVAEALSGSQQPSTDPRFPQPSRTSVDPPVPMSGTTTYPPPQGPPPGQKWAVHGRANGHDEEDDALLAYMTSHDEHFDDHRVQLPEQQGRAHVRFGGVSEIDEIENPVGSQSPRNGLPPQYTEDIYEQPLGRNSTGPGPEIHLNTPPPSSSGTSLPVDPQFPRQQRIPPPTMSPEEEERALNAAAAREISRELDALNFNPPIPLAKDEEINPHHQNPPQPPIMGSNGLPQLNEDNAGPLAPPIAPFSRRTPSPRPSVNTGTPTYPGTPQYAGSIHDQHTESISPLQPRGRSPPHQHEQSSPTVAPRSPLAINLPDQPSRLSPAPSSPYQTPPEYPRGRSASGTPITKSAPSLPLPALGTRTISAAAFRRPPQRMASGDVPIPLSDTSPLSFKKRLPSSPHPQQRDASPMSRNPSSQLPPAPPQPTGKLPPVPATDADDEYDYLSAYVTSGDAGEPGDRSHGYGEGRFATDLEGSSLR